MRLLHTSDWHIGRTFHTHSTLDHLRRVLDGIAAIVRDERIDVVLVAGDVFDSAAPSADSYRLLRDALRAIRSARARIVLTSGNHDSATRLGFQSEWLGESGIHVLTDHETLDTPVLIGDEHGTVAVYGIPYLEPSMLRHHYPEVELRTHAQALGFAMNRIRADLEPRGARSVVLSHCFAAGVADVPSVSASDVERDITAGGLDLVPAAVFEGVDYAALGHIHGRATIAEGIRYSGAPVHYSFSEAGKPRGGWIIDLDAAGLASVRWIDLPIPRPLVELTGSLDHLLTDPAHAGRESDWVKAVVTDRVRPMEAMRRLQARFPFCVALEHRPDVVARVRGADYGERVRAKSDPEIVAGFLEHVRNGAGPDEFERALLAELVTDASITEIRR